VGPENGQFWRRIITNKRAREHTQAYLKNYDGMLKGTTTKVDAAMYRSLKEKYELRSAGKNYLREYIRNGTNSNAVLPEVVEGAGGEVEGDLGWTPGRKNRFF
jgi:hypothetical protein